VLADAEQFAKVESSKLAELAAAGIPVWLETKYHNAHNKVVVIDAAEPGAIVITGSFNFTWSAQHTNAENVLIARNSPVLAARYAANWERHRQQATFYKKMTQTAISSLWSDVWADLSDHSLMAQLATVVACIALGWGIARILRSTFSAKDVQQRVVRLGVESFYSVLSPVLALILVAIAKPVLASWHYHNNLLRLAIPLLVSFALIRLAFYVMRRVFVRGGAAGNAILLFEKVFAMLVWAAVALYITGLWPDLIGFLDDTLIPIGRFKASLLTILQALASVAVTLIVALWVGALLEDRLMRLDTMHSSLRLVMARMGRAVLVLIAVLVSLSLVGIDLTVLSVFGGALGVRDRSGLAENRGPAMSPAL